MNTIPEKPAVSVITPTYDRYNLLNRAMRSVMNQEFENWEMIIISDGNDDKDAFYDFFPTFIGSPRNEDKRLNILYDRFHFIQLPFRFRDTGSTPKNVGLMIARGKYIAYLDDDNEFMPNHLKDLVNLIEKTNTDFVYSSTLLRNQSEPTKDLGIRNSKQPHYGGIDTSEILHKADAPMKFGFWHNTDWDDIYPWGKRTGYYGTDWELINRWLKNGATWAHSEEVSLIYYYNR